MLYDVSHIKKKLGKVKRYMKSVQDTDMYVFLCKMARQIIIQIV